MKILSRTVGAFQENAYLVIDETTNNAVLIDPGAEPDVLVEMVRSSGARLEAIWLTHAHIDHIGGIAGVQRAWNVPLHLHPADMPLFERGAVQAANYGIPFETPAAPDIDLAHGDKLTIGSLVFDVIHTPGHAPGHVVFVNERTMLGGDLLFAGSIGRTDLPLSNAAHMQESLAKICELDADTVVYPGHGPRTTIGHERATNGFLTGLARLMRR
jgi:hydroxyacylglutathione hydrolase